jgi:hypothetical protein
MTLVMTSEGKHAHHLLQMMTSFFFLCWGFRHDLLGQIIEMLCSSKQAGGFMGRIRDLTSKMEHGEDQEIGIELHTF